MCLILKKKTFFVIIACMKTQFEVSLDITLPNNFLFPEIAIRLAQLNVNYDQY